jgi:hypothetical protein
VNRTDLATGLRVVGAAAALLLLGGVLQGSMWIVFAGLTMAAAGRLLIAPDRDSRIAVVLSLVVLCGAVAALCLRWNTLDASAVRGTQAVLGPTLLVGPRSVATGAWLVTGAAALALGVWMASGPRLADTRSTLLGVGELKVVALAVAVPAWGPVAAGDPDMGAGLLGVLVATICLAAAGFGFALLVRGKKLIWIPAGASVAGFVAGAVMLGGAA